MYVETKKIIKRQDVVFMEDSMSARNDLVMHLNRQMVDVVNKSSKLPCIRKDEKYKTWKKLKSLTCKSRRINN